MLTSLLVTLLALAAPAAAADIPTTLNQQGRLLDAAGVPLQGVHSVTFSLYDAPAGGSALWTETHDLTLAEGAYAATLGDQVALDATLTGSDALWLAIAVDAGTELPGRLPLHSVPYARRAATADAVPGDIAPASVTVGSVEITSAGISVGGQTLIDGGGAWVGGSTTVSAGEGLTGDGSASDPVAVDFSVVPARDELAAVATSGAYADLTGVPTLAAVATSGAYADLSGLPTLAAVATSGAYADLSGRPSLAAVATSGAYADLSGRPSLSTVATSGQFADLTGVPAGLADGDNDALGALSCSNGQVAKRVGNAWACAADADTTYSAGSGLQLSAGAFSLDPAANNDIRNQTSPQSASFNITGSGTVGGNLVVGGVVESTAAWGQNARTQGLMVMPEGPVYENNGVLTLAGNVIVMNPAAGSFLRVAAGTYDLTAAWSYLYVDLPPTSTSGATVTPRVATWSDSTRPYDARDRLVLAQRRSSGEIYLNFAQPATQVTPQSSLITIQGPNLGDYRNNSSVVAAGTWWTIPNRTLAFTKRHSSSMLKVTYQDTLGTLGRYYDGCEWRILLDGAQIAYFSDADSDDSAVYWRMNNAAHVAWASSVAPGNHSVVVQNRGSRGAWSTTGTQECLQGWNTTGNFLSVEEIP